MQSLARFVIRPADGDKGDLLLGAMLKEQQPDLLRPGVVYEIREIFGVLTIAPIGEAAIGPRRDTSMVGVNWAQDVSHLLNSANGQYLLTREECQQPGIKEKLQVF